jgi:DNA-binding SARP family transcriptional activator
MDFRVLGPLEVAESGCLLPLGGRKQRALLALLLLRANQVVPTERLIDELWSGEPPPTAVKTVQVYVSRLRKVLGADALATRQPGYVLPLAPGQLDLDRFEALRAAGRLHEALALWRGSPLADLAYEPSLQAEIARLDELRLATLEARISADLAAGHASERVAELEALIAQHPLRERLRALLMVALYRSGRQAEALRAYRDTRRSLVGELGIEPSPELRLLEHAILRHDPELTDQRRARLVTVMRVEDEDEEPVRRAVTAHGGRPLASTAGLIATFDSTRDAVSCALELRRRARIGLNLGYVAEEHDRVVGAAIAGTLQIAGHAGPGEALVTEAVRNLASGVPGVSFRDRGYFAFPGFDQPWHLYEIEAPGVFVRPD